VDKEEEKETYPPAGFSSQDFPYRDNYPCQSVPVGKYLQVLDPQIFSPHSRTTSATTSTGHITAGITIRVALYLLVFTCREKA
jgi:hypothetical protein